ncbi:MAG: FG-GAP-like repeat-containing protein [Terriglobales bacterium]|jgi:uncharacterized protein (DUF2141 family)
MTRQRIPKIRILSASVLFVIVIAVLTVFAGSAIAQNPVPFLDQPLVPDATAPGGAGFTLTVNGAGFVSSSTVDWNGSPLATTFIKGTQLTAAVPASDIATASTAAVTVVSPSPGGGVSSTLYFSIAVAGASVSFLPPKTYETGGINPSSVAIADLRGDGKLDLVVAQCSTNSCPQAEGSVGVLLGNGDGTFQPPTVYDAGGWNASSVIVTDVNGDGKLDIVVAGGCDPSLDCAGAPFIHGYVGVLLGNGDGTFQPVATYSSGDYYAVSVAAADVNGNGKLDLVVANGFGEGSVGVLLGNGDGTFQPAVTYDSGGYAARSVAVGDVNGDGKLDLVVANFVSSVAGVLLGNGDGTFQPAVTYYVLFGVYMASIALADVNGDGKLDILTSNCGYNECSIGNSGGDVGVLLGNGDGTFLQGVAYSAGNSPISIAIADMNGDGKQDVVVANWGSSDSINGAGSVLLANGDGTFQPAQTYLSGGNEATSVAVADLTGDGRPDIVLGDFGSGGTNPPPGIVSVLLNNTGPCVGKCPTSVARASSLNPSIYGQKVTWTATVTTSGSVTPTGTVNFTWDGYSIGTATLNASGVATLTKSNLNVYTYPLTAVYSGDANNASSKSAILNQVVKETTSAATLSSSPNPSTQGQAVTFTATITSPTVTATGPVTFTAGKTVLGTAQLSGGKAKFTTSTLPVGSTTATATYNGDSNIAESSASVTQTVQP